MRRTTIATLLALALSAGCAHSVNELARETSRAAVDESVEKLTEDDTKKDIAGALTDPRMTASIKEITDHVIEGVLNGLESERAQRQLAQATGTATRAAAQEIVRTLGGPAVRDQVAGLTQHVVDSALDDLGGKLQQDFVPGLRTALERELAEGGAAALRNPQLSDALGATAQTVAYQAAVGVNDGLIGSWFGGDASSGMRGLASTGTRWLTLALVGLGLLALIVVSAAVIVIARARRARTEVMRLETATLLLATAMRERHESKDTDEIVSVVRDALEKSAEAHQRHGLLGALRLRLHHH